MAIITSPPRTVSDIKTHSGRVSRDHQVYRDYFQVGALELERWRRANERDVALTNDEAIDVLQTLLNQHNAQYGIKWEDLTTHIEDRVLGRKLTRAEIKRFVERDILTVQK